MGLECFSKMSNETFGCLPSCSGLYSYVQFVANSQLGDEKNRQTLDYLTKQYSRYKANWAKNIIFDPQSNSSFGMALLFHFISFHIQSFRS